MSYYLHYCVAEHVTNSDGELGKLHIKDPDGGNTHVLCLSMRNSTSK